MARLLPAKWVWWYRDKRCQMGYSKRIYNEKKWHKTIAPLRPTFESLGLKEDDVARLHEQFLKIDKDGSGTIELWEMLDHLDLKRNRFAKRVFAIFDVDGSNEIDFKEFVVALWQYCTLGRPQLVMFAFDLYDRDSSGAIDSDEFNAMLKELLEAWRRFGYNGVRGLEFPEVFVAREGPRPGQRGRGDDEELEEELELLELEAAGPALGKISRICKTLFITFLPSLFPSVYWNANFVNSTGSQ